MANFLRSGHDTHSLYSEGALVANNHTILTIDGSRYSGSGTIVRQAVAFSALTGRPIRVIRARAKRAKPGLRPQHVRVVEAIAQLVDGHTEGLAQGSQEFSFHPGPLVAGRPYTWDIGSAGSTTMLALGVLPVLAFTASPVSVELRGGLFQDFAPSAFHLQYVLLPLLHRMGLQATVLMGRPGYVPQGHGRLTLVVQPLTVPFEALNHDHPGPVTSVWGIALSSHLSERQVSRRMADAAHRVLAQAGYPAEIEIRQDTEAVQRGAALALFAEEGNGVRLGADQAGARQRTAEAIGHHVAQQLIDDLRTGSTLDRHAADQIIPFAAMARGVSRFIIPAVTDHVQTSAWLAELFFDARVTYDRRHLVIQGAAVHPRRPASAHPVSPHDPGKDLAVRPPHRGEIAAAMLKSMTRLDDPGKGNGRRDRDETGR